MWYSIYSISIILHPGSFYHSSLKTSSYKGDLIWDLQQNSRIVKVKISEAERAEWSFTRAPLNTHGAVWSTYPIFNRRSQDPEALLCGSYAGTGRALFWRFVFFLEVVTFLCRSLANRIALDSITHRYRRVLQCHDVHQRYGQRLGIFLVIHRSRASYNVSLLHAVRLPPSPSYTRAILRIRLKHPASLLGIKRTCSRSPHCTTQKVRSTGADGSEHGVCWRPKRDRKDIRYHRKVQESRREIPLQPRDVLLTDGSRNSTPWSGN